MSKIYLIAKKESINCGHNMDRDIIQLLTKDPWDIRRTHPFFNTLKEAENYCESVELDNDHILEITNCDDNSIKTKTEFSNSNTVITEKDTEITRLQNENMSVLDQLNKWSEVVEQLTKKNQLLSDHNERLLRDMKDISKMQRVMNNLNLQRNKNKKGIIVPNQGGRII